MIHEFKIGQKKLVSDNKKLTLALYHNNGNRLWKVKFATKGEVDFNFSVKRELLSLMNKKALLDSSSCYSRGVL